MDITIHRANPFEDCVEVTVAYTSDEIIERDIVIHIVPDADEDSNTTTNETKENDSDSAELPF